ncbi:MAG: hypothetical protein ABFC24_10940 [Methanoregulaceae archaeon]
MYEPDSRTSGQIVSREKIRWLKNFTSKLVVQGQIIHDIIHQQIRKHCESRPMRSDDTAAAFSLVLLRSPVGKSGQMGNPGVN